MLHPKRLKQKLENIGWIFLFEAMTKSELEVAEKMIGYTNKFLTIRQQMALFTAIYYNEIGLLPRIVEAINSDKISSDEKAWIMIECLNEMPRYDFNSSCELKKENTLAINDYPQLKLICKLSKNTENISVDEALYRYECHWDLIDESTLTPHELELINRLNVDKTIHLEIYPYKQGANANYSYQKSLRQAQ